MISQEPEFKLLQEFKACRVEVMDCWSRGLAGLGVHIMVLGDRVRGSESQGL